MWKTNFVWPVLAVLWGVERVFGLAGMPGDFEVWMGLFEMIPDFLGGVFVTLTFIFAWNQWIETIVRKRLGLRDEFSFWYAIQFWWHWKQIEREEKRKNRR